MVQEDPHFHLEEQTLFVTDNRAFSKMAQCVVIDAPTNLTVVVISQTMCLSNHYDIVRHEYI